MVETHTVVLSTRGNADVQDITGRLAKAVAESGMANGTVTVFCPSSTSALTTIEYEAGAVSDLRRLFDEIIPPGRGYAHEVHWGDGNGHSHVRAALLGPSLTIPFIERELTLGTWQQVVHVDFDVRARQRELILQLIGE
jgi:secondary thiamine-phosphate synthase enzyme